MRKKRYLKSSISALLALGMACALPLGGISASAEGYVSVLDGSEYVHDSTKDISSEQGETILDNEISKEEYTDYAAADGGVISDERLADSIIEYDELGTFVQKYNPTMMNTRASIASSDVQYQTIKSEILSEYIESIQLSSTYKYDEEEAEDYATYNGYREVYKSAIQSYNSIIDNFSSQSTVRSLKSAEKSLTYAAQSLMISYNTLEQTRQTLSKSAELYQALYDSTSVMVAAGTATEADLMAAYNSLQSAQDALSSIEVSQGTVYDSLCLLLGVSTDAGYTIGPIPDPDTSYLSSIDKDADLEAYVNSYADVVSERHTSSGSTAGMLIKDAQLKETEGEAKVSYQAQYTALSEAQAEYEAALTGYESTLTSWNIAQSKKSLGMLSTAEYLEEELSYISGAGELESARIALFSAVNDYKWGLIGVS